VYAFKRYGWKSYVVLHGMGGLACPEGSWRQPPAGKSQIFISAAGPGAGFVFAAVLVALLLIFGRTVSFLDWDIGRGDPLEDPLAYILVAHLLYINILWGIFNLAPVYPLDGGQISRALLSRRSEQEGVRLSLWLSVWCGIFFAIAGAIWFRSVFFPLFFGYLAFASYDVLRRQLGEPGLMDSPPIGWIKRKFRRGGAGTKKTHPKKRHLHLVKVETEDENKNPTPEVEATARDLLRRLNDDISKDRRKGSNGSDDN
jgi:membrane-associated protease RseP (regulator of RpoE activity)